MLLPDLLAYHRWADTRLLAAMANLSRDAYTAPFPDGNASPAATLVHLAAAGVAWITRLEGGHVKALLTEADLPSFERAAETLRETHYRLDALLKRYDETALQTPFHYVTTKGDAYTLRLAAVFVHVVNHGTYHRGQLANKLARRGVTPPATDFSLWDATRTA